MSQFEKFAASQWVYSSATCGERFLTQNEIADYRELYPNSQNVSLGAGAPFPCVHGYDGPESSPQPAEAPLSAFLSSCVSPHRVIMSTAFAVR